VAIASRSPGPFRKYCQGSSTRPWNFFCKGRREASVIQGNFSTISLCKLTHYYVSLFIVCYRFLFKYYVLTLIQHFQDFTCKNYRPTTIFMLEQDDVGRSTYMTGGWCITDSLALRSAGALRSAADPVWDPVSPARVAGRGRRVPAGRTAMQSGRFGSPPFHRLERLWDPRAHRQQ